MSFWSRLTMTAKSGIVLVICAVLGYFVVWPYIKANPGLLTRITGQASQEVSGVNLPSVTVGTDTSAPATLGKPAYSVDQVRAENVGTWRHASIAWNGSIGIIYAVGGKTTLPGSFMQQYGLNTTLTRIDDYGVMQGELIKFASAYSQGEQNPQVGMTSVTIMGDATASFMAGLQPQLDKLHLHAKVIGATGRSYGEDKFMGPAAWKENPQSAKGGVIAAVPRDGDIHIAYVWAQANGIKINPDKRTWDPDALNIFETDSFTDADQAYISGTCENRPVVQNGKGTGETKHVCVNAVVTWTPGDVAVNDQKGGVVTLLSTRENGAQMFATIIVIDEWARAHPATTTNFLKAALDGSAAVANDRAKLHQAAAMSADVWGEQNADYWEKYYYGHTDDVRGVPGYQIRLGGSQAFGLAANVQYFLPEGQSVFDRVVQTFGDFDSKLYPDIMPSYPHTVTDTSFIEKIRSMGGDAAVAKNELFPKFTGDETSVVGNTSYAINFAVGSATILPSSEKDLNAILNSVTVGSDLAFHVDGYTSSEGDAEYNQRLSEARANSVKNWLVAHAPHGLIDESRVHVNGHGATSLKTDSFGREDRIKSRRVEITLLSKSE